MYVNKIINKFTIFLIIVLLIFFKFDFIYVKALDNIINNEYDENEEDNKEEEEYDEEYDEITEYETLTNEDIDDSLLCVPITYSEESYYVVTIPKNIILNKNGNTDFTIKVTGNISPAYNIEVDIIDKIDNIKGINLYITNLGVKLLANVIHNKTIWNYEDVKNGIESIDKIIIKNMYPGEWEGELCFKISTKEIYNNHIHNYIEKILEHATCKNEGLMLYSCDCGDSYIDTIDTIDHNYVNSYCKMCGESQDEEYEDDEDEETEEEETEDEEYEDEEYEEEEIEDEEYEDEETEDDEDEDEEYEEEETEDEETEDEE